MSVLLEIVEKQFHELKEECISLQGYSRQLIELSNYPLFDKKIILNDLETKKFKEINKKISIVFDALNNLREKLENL